MRKKYFYTISYETDEYHSKIGYIANSFEECRSHLMEFTNWYEKPGSCKIRKIGCDMTVYEVWTFVEGVEDAKRHYKLNQKSN